MRNGVFEKPCNAEAAGWTRRTKNETNLIIKERRSDGVKTWALISEAVIVLDEGRYPCAWSARCKHH